jgi:hypothetical protein
MAATSATVAGCRRDDSLLLRDLIVTHSNPYDDEISSREDFERAIRSLLVVALRNDVDPRGSWEYRTEDTHPDFEAVVVELQARDESDRERD